MPAKAAAALLWCALGLVIALVAMMTWHPWVIGETAGCRAGMARAWDGNCYPGAK